MYVLWSSIVFAASPSSAPAPAPGASTPATAATPAATATAPAPGSLDAKILEVMDASADPCVDFYQYACGGWAKTTTLPPDRPILTRGFTAIEDRNEELLRKILDDAAKSTDPADLQLGAFWTSCNDEARIDAQGATPLQAWFAPIDAALRKDNKKSRKKLMGVVGELQAAGYDPLLGMFVDGDAKNPELVILQLFQGGIGLPERDYYLDAQHAAIKAQYQEHVSKLFGLAGWAEADAARAATDVVAFETELAKLSWAPEQLMDATLTYNKLDLAGLEAITPGMRWDALLTAVGRPDLTQINVMTPSYFEGVAQLVADTPVPVIATYLKWRVLSGSASELADPLADEAFRFHGTVLTGQKEQRPRWKRCIDYADFALGDLLAQKYVAAAFPGESKPVAVDMITRIEAAFEEGLPGLSWMDEATREQAIGKARAVKNKIGYPSRWRDYPFAVQPDDFFGNIRRANLNNNTWYLAKVEKPVDPDNWLMTAPTVNAYYNPSANEIVFPAGILQPPFFSVEYPRAINFGAMGMVMGHEITHGFDDEGRKYDGTGKLTDWWAPDAVQKFEAAAACVEEQYDGYQILPPDGEQPAVNVKGELTLGENIADLGGTRVAYRAYQKWVAENGAEAPVAGLTGDQLFFVAMAQGWCSVASPQIQRVRAETDPHSPPRFRVNGPLTNLPEFAEAFQCEVGEPMRPKDTCEVW